MTPNRRVSRGSVGGASDDAGVEYRRAVAAYAAACGLAGIHVAGLGIPEPDAFVEVIALETEGAIDDIEISFTTGWKASIQAKRSLRRGTSLTKAIGQWVEAGKAGVDPSRQRLVIASGSLTGPMRRLQTALNRRRLDPAGPPTAQEQDIVDHVEGLLSELTSVQRSEVLDAAVIWEIAVEEPDQPGAREAIAHLLASGFSITPIRVTAIWAELRAAAGRLARNRAGASLPGWLLELRRGGVVLEHPGENPAGRIERQRVALGRYCDRLVRESREIDLRALGARLPPLSIDGADSGVKVRTDPEDPRDRADLVWAFLRLGRVVVTALPGGGKSTALKRVAGDLATKVLSTACEATDCTHYPFPVRASLRDINAYSDTMSFRDRLISAATRDDSTTDRGHVRVEIEDRLDNDRPVALLLDALDETYGDRARVVADLDSFLRSVPTGVCVLIATRDVAFGEAATLGWHDLRLLPPEEPTAPVGPLLAAAAEHLGVKSLERDDWVAQRTTWVNSVLHREQSLRETPLTPLLLAVLAIEQNPELLPQTRAAVLRDVVTTVVSRRELRRQDGQALGPLSGSDLDSAATRAFGAEGSTILHHNGIAPVEAAMQAIAWTLAAHWGLSAGHSESAGRDAVRLFDETGLFVVDHAASTISSRLTLFSEIADAINAIRNLEGVSGWVAERVGEDKVEPVVLAATLDSVARQTFEAAFKAERDNDTLIRGALQILKDGIKLSEEVLHILREQAIEKISSGTQEGWLSWTTLCDLELPVGLAPAAVTAASVHSVEHALLVQASVDLESRTQEAIRVEPGAVLEVLRFAHLPPSPRANDVSNRSETPDDWRHLLGANTPLADIQVRAAETLMNYHPEVTDLIAKIASDRSISRGHKERLVTLLADNGQGDLAKHLRSEESMDYTSFDWIGELDHKRHGHFLDLLAERQNGELATEQAVRLDELGDFLETLGLNDAGSQHFYKETDAYIRDIAGLAAVLFGFDMSVIASQAKIARARMAAEGYDHGDDWLDSYFSLFTFATERSRNDWASVSDLERSVDLALKLFWQGRGQARLAMKMLWGAQQTKEYAAPLLRSLIEDVRSSPAHQRMVAITLVTLRTAEEPSCWIASDNPVLRAVAARTIRAFEDGRPTSQFTQLLFDQDGHVRREALESIAAESDPAVDDLLAEVADSRPGWMCLSCRTVNSDGLATACTKEKCLTSNPRPDEIAAKLLADRRTGRDT